MFNRGKYRRYGYIIKANWIYTFLPVFVLLLLLGGSFAYPISRITMIQLFQIIVPYMSLFWILPIKEERLTVGWGEIICSDENSKKILFEYIIKNVTYILIYAGVCFCCSKKMGSLKIFFIEVVFQIIMMQGIGLLFLHFSHSMFTAFCIPFLFMCISLMLLGQSADFVLKGYICEYEVGLAEFCGQQWFYLVPGIGCNGFLLKK